jgi:HSP20 family protein
MTRTIVGVNPWNELRTMEEVFERLLGTQTRNTGAVALPIDVTERDGHLLIKAAVPGVDPNELQVQVEQNVLTIRGELKAETAEDEKVYRREISYGSFVRSLRLPDGYDVEKIEAEFKHGVVTIRVPKSEEQKPKTIQINVRS